MRTGEAVDPFTLEIIKNGLVAAGDEMFYALQRAAMSPIIYEVLDYATGLTDRSGQLLTQGNGVAGFLGASAPADLPAIRSGGVGAGPATLAADELAAVQDVAGATLSRLGYA